MKEIQQGNLLILGVLGVLGVLFGVLCVLFGIFCVLFGVLDVLFDILGVLFFKSSPFRVLCGKRYAGLKKVHHPRW